LIDSPARFLRTRGGAASSLIKFLLLGTSHALLLGAPAYATEACDLVAPPRAAAVDAAHEQYVFIFPRDMQKGYTGCQTVWGPRGTPLFSLEFDQGALVSYQQFEASHRNAALTCRYAGKVLKTRSRKCPAYEDLASGVITMSLQSEQESFLRVPPESDPRRD
jgi:hypothetical protein